MHFHILGDKRKRKLLNNLLESKKRRLGNILRSESRVQEVSEARMEGNGGGESQDHDARLYQSR